MRRRKLKVTSDWSLEHAFPSMICPVCGKEFLIKKDWGCVVSMKGTRYDSAKVCSIPCMKKLEDMLIEQDALHARNSRILKTYKLHVIDGLSKEEVQKILGHPTLESVKNDADNAETMYFREILWLDEHDAWLPSLSPAATSLPEGETRSAS